jgi:hypothetical protein
MSLKQLAKTIWFWHILHRDRKPLRLSGSDQPVARGFWHTSSISSPHGANANSEGRGDFAPAGAGIPTFDYLGAIEHDPGSADVTAGSCASHSSPFDDDERMIAPHFLATRIARLQVEGTCTPNRIETPYRD